jgi:hypothetical protein
MSIRSIHFWPAVIWFSLMGGWPLVPHNIHDIPWQDAGPWLALDWGLHLAALWMGIAVIYARWQTFQRNLQD